MRYLSPSRRGHSNGNPDAQDGDRGGSCAKVRGKNRHAMEALADGLQTVRTVNKNQGRLNHTPPPRSDN
jgi:hypothetical protein